MWARKKRPRDSASKESLILRSRRLEVAINIAASESQIQDLFSASYAIEVIILDSIGSQVIRATPLSF
jgi:hypothetical protein